MINAEKFKNEIEGKDFKFGMSNRIINCDYGECGTCIFSCENNPNDGLHTACTIRKVKWLLSECKESTKVTRLEYELLKYWNGKRYKYIARDRDGALYIYRDKPSKNEDVWGTLYGHARLMKYFDDLFCFVKWEDKEPIGIKEVLENCVIKNIKEEQ